MQATFLSERRRHIVPIHWDASSISSYHCEPFVVVMVQTAHRTVSAIPCLKRQLSPVGETFWSLGHRSEPPMEYQPVYVEFPAGSEPKLGFEAIAHERCKLILAESPEPWPEALDGWVRDIEGKLVSVPLAPRLAHGPPTSEGRSIVSVFSLHAAKAVLKMDINGYKSPSNAAQIPPVTLEWDAFERFLHLDEAEPMPRTEKDP